MTEGTVVDQPEAAGQSMTVKGGWLARHTSVATRLAIGVLLVSVDAAAELYETDSERLAFNVWGNPRRRAEALAASADASEILVDSAVTSHVGNEWAVDPALGLVGLDGAPLDGWRVVGMKRDIESG